LAFLQVLHLARFGFSIAYACLGTSFFVWALLLSHRHGRPLWRCGIEDFIMVAPSVVVGGNAIMASFRDR
jgi:hypothetical protein